MKIFGGWNVAFSRSMGRSWRIWVGAVISLALVFSVWLFVRDSERRSLELRFNDDVDLVVERIGNRMKSHVQILSAASEFASLRPGSVTRQEWRDYVAALRLDELNPGVQALGYAVWVARDQLDEHVRLVRAEGFPDYDVDTGGNMPPGEEGVSSILFIEPFDERNQRAFSRDMYAEATRRVAMIRARDNGLVTLTARVTLYQETSTGVQAGTLLYAPAYRQGRPLDTVAERRSAFLGWPYMAFRMQKLMSEIVGDAETLMYLDVYDGASEGAGDLLYASGRQESGNDAPSVRRNFELAGRMWTLRATPRAGFILSLIHI